MQTFIILYMMVCLGVWLLIGHSLRIADRHYDEQTKEKTGNRQIEISKQNKYT